jgi:3-isopropylmalate dehydrogenase
MLPSASFGKSVDGRPEHAVYEPVHGSAPDIAGQGKANPLAMILSLGMMLHYSFNRSDLAKQISDAVEHVLTRGLRTADIASGGCRIVTTAEMGDAVVDALSKQEMSS